MPETTSAVNIIATMPKLDASAESGGGATEKTSPAIRILYPWSRDAEKSLCRSVDTSSVMEPLLSS